MSFSGVSQYGSPNPPARGSGSRLPYGRRSGSSQGFSIGEAMLTMKTMNDSRAGVERLGDKRSPPQPPKRESASTVSSTSQRRRATAKFVENIDQNIDDLVAEENYSELAWEMTELASSSSTGMDLVVDQMLKAIRRTIGAKNYYDVWTIFLRPIVVISTVTGSGLSAGWQTFLIIIAILALCFSFPFIVMKMEEASYMTKVHYPFLMSNAVGDKLKREVMIQTLNNMKEEVAINTAFLGSFTELLLILGSLMLVIANAIDTQNYGSIIVGFFSFVYSLYNFWKEIVKCMEIMCFKGQDTYMKWCCAPCYCCLMGSSKEEKLLIPTQMQSLREIISDTKMYTQESLDVPRFVDLQSAVFRQKYCDALHGGNDAKTYHLNFEMVQKEVPINSAVGKAKYEVKDRYGLLTFMGAVRLLQLEKEDKVQLEKEKQDAEKDNSGIGSRMLCCLCVALKATFAPVCGKCVEVTIFFVKAVTCIPFFFYYIDLWAKTVIAMWYSCAFGLPCVFGWLMRGFNTMRALSDACVHIAKHRAKELKLTDKEVKSLRDGSYLEELCYLEVLNHEKRDGSMNRLEIIKEVGHGMPWGCGWLSPLAKLHPLCRSAMFACNPIRSRKPRKFSVTQVNLMNVTVCAELLFKTELVVPHSQLTSFPYSVYPLHLVYWWGLIKLAISLQAIRDVLEIMELKRLGLINAGEGGGAGGPPQSPVGAAMGLDTLDVVVTPRIVEVIKRLRGGVDGSELLASGKEQSQEEDLECGDSGTAMNPMALMKRAAEAGSSTMPVVKQIGMQRL